MPETVERRTLLVNLDFRDFVYSHLWGRSVVDACTRRRITVDVVASHPLAGRDLGAELGIRWPLDSRPGTSAVYLEQPDEARARTVIDELLARHRYDTLILNCEAALFIHLMMERARPLSDTRWLVYDRHLHVDLRAHDADPQLRERMVTSGMDLFAIREMVTGTDPRQPSGGGWRAYLPWRNPLAGPRDVFATPAAVDETVLGSFRRLGLTREKIHFHLWPLDDAYFAPQPDRAPAERLPVFSGGDSGRDYATLFAAIRDLPIDLRLCAGSHPQPVPPNVTVLPRLRLQQFRDEIARAAVVVVPLTGQPPVSGITVIAIARMLGKAVIASDNPVVRMHIPEPGYGGSLVPIGDAAALRAQLERLIRSPSERERLGSDARAAAASDLSLRGFVEEILAVSDPAPRPSQKGAPVSPLRASGPRVLLLCPVVTDTLYGATFFGLARALAAHDARVDVVSPWAVHRDVGPAFAERQPVKAPDTGSVVERFVADAPLDEYELIIAPDIPTGRRLLARGPLPDRTQVAITDFHLLWGMDDLVRERCAPGQGPQEGGWWPSERVFVYSAFRGYAHLYENYGVPMEQVVWQPYALDPASFPSRCPAIDGTTIISAGRHLRDIETLLAAAARLDETVHPIDLFAEGELARVPRRVRFRRTVPSSVFCPEVGRSRFMVVPLVSHPHKPAGITAMATATMCGRPIIATATAAARDYVADGVNGLLVPPSDAEALAATIRRLDTDHDLLARLAAGARDRAAELTTDAWAQSLLTGTEPRS